MYSNPIKNLIEQVLSVERKIQALLEVVKHCYTKERLADIEEETIIVVSVLGGISLLLLVLVAVLFSQVSSLRRRLEDLNDSGRLRVQKLKLENDKNHAFHNPTISPDEELAQRGFTMYSRDDAESGRASPPPRQTGGQLLEELSRELDHRHRRKSQQDEDRRQRDQSREEEYQARQQEYQSRQQEYQSHQPQNLSRQPENVSRQSENHYRQPENLSRQQENVSRQSENHYRQPDNLSRRPENHSRQPEYQQTKQPASFLLHSIEENKRKSRQLVNPIANGRQSDTNPNFIY